MRDKRKLGFILGVLLCGLSASVRADDWLELEPVIKRTSIARQTLADPAFRQTSIDADSGLQRGRSGTPALGISEELAIPLRDAGVPGGLSQIAGPGRSAEEWSTQTLGVPLGTILGGGTDFGIWPAFLWSDAWNSFGPTLGSLDLRASTGTTDLDPWTAAKVRRSEDGWCGGMRAFYSSTQVAQLSARGCYGGRTAANAGWSVGRSRGVSGSVSTRFSHPGSQAGQWSAHVLGTRLDSEVYPAFVSASAHAQTSRLVPIIEYEREMDSGWTQKSTAYYDGTEYLFYADSGPGQLQALNISQQAGAQIAIQNPHWWVGMGGRLAQARISGFSVPEPSGSWDHQVHAQVRRIWKWDATLLVPQLQLLYANGAGLFPQASLSASFLDRRLAFRTTYAQRIPSLSDRYFVIPGFFSGNAQLAPEHVVSVVTEGQVLPVDYALQLQMLGFLQGKVRPVLPIQSGGIQTLTNGTGALLSSFAVNGTWSPVDFFEWRQAVRFQYSRLMDSGSNYPLLPAILMVGALTFHAPGGLRSERLWSVSLGGRAQTDTLASASGGFLGGYVIWDLRAELRPRLWGWRGLKVWGSLDNLTDRAYAIDAYTPAWGRSVSVGIEAVL